MDTIPQIISTKDLAYLSDMFEWNKTAFKQVNHFINEVNNEEIKELLERVKNMHEDHMSFIISILKKEEYDECDCDESEYEEEYSEEENIDE